MGEANKTAAGNQKKVILTVISPTPIENQRLNTGKCLISWNVQKGNENPEGGTKKKKVTKNPQKELVDIFFNYIQISMAY